MLEDLDISYTQQLFGKLVIEPPPAVRGGKSVTFWPAGSVFESLDGQRRDSKTSAHSSKLSRIRVTNSGLRVPMCQAQVTETVPGGTLEGSQGS